MIEVDMFNPTRNSSQNDREEKQNAILEILEAKAPNITWGFHEEDKSEEDPDRLIVRGSFVHPDGQEYVAKTGIWNMKFSMPMHDIVEDVARAYEQDRKNKLSADS